MYPILIQQSEATAAQRRVPIWLVDATDGITAETGVTGNARISKQGGVSAASTNTITQIDATNMPGLYYIELTAAEVDTVGVLFLSFKTAATAQWHGTAFIVPYDPYDSVRLGLTALPNAAAEAAGGLYTRGVGAGQINQQTNGQIDANVERWLNVVVKALISGRVDSHPLADVSTQGQVNDALPTSSAFTVDTIAAGADRWKGQTLTFISGPIVGESRVISSQGGVGNLDLTFDRPFSGAPADNDFFAIKADLAGVLTRAIETESDGMVHADVKEWLALVPNALAAGLVQSFAGDLGAASKTAVNVEVADVLKTDTVAERAQQIPPATPTMEDILMYLYMAFRNDSEATATERRIKNDAGTVIAKATMSEAAGTFNQGELFSGP